MPFKLQLNLKVGLRYGLVEIIKKKINKK